jgi:hypothetical protein
MHTNVVSMDQFRERTGRHIGGSVKHSYDQILYDKLRDLPPDAIRGAQHHFRNNFNAGCDPESCLDVTARFWRMRSRRGGFDPRPAA